MALVLLDRVDGVATITLNRPEAMNALSQELRRELCSAIQTVSIDKTIHALIVTGAGDRAFTAGLDLKELGQSGLGPANDRDASTNPIFALTNLPIPVIGAINASRSPVDLNSPWLATFALLLPMPVSRTPMPVSALRRVGGYRRNYLGLSDFLAPAS